MLCYVWARKRAGSKHPVLSFRADVDLDRILHSFCKKAQCKGNTSGLRKRNLVCPWRTHRDGIFTCVLSYPERGLKARGSAWVLGGDVGPPAGSALASVGISLGSSPSLQAEQAPGPAPSGNWVAAPLCQGSGQEV